MPTITWQVRYDQMDPYSDRVAEDAKERVLYLRELLDIEFDEHYTLEELEEMFDNADWRDHEG